MELLNRSSQPVEDRRRFMRAIAFNFLVMGSDAHAKNYSLLLGRAGRVRLARLYDLASLLPYVDQHRELRFAMKIGGYYKDSQIQPRHIEKLSRACAFPSQELLAMIAGMAANLPEAAIQIREEMTGQQIKHPIVDKLVQLLLQRAGRIQRTFAL